MVQFVSLIREIMPAWLSRRSSGQTANREPEHPLPQDADAVWHQIVEKDTFGANTPDYTLVEDSGDRPLGQTRSPSRQ